MRKLLSILVLLASLSAVWSAEVTNTIVATEGNSLTASREVAAGYDWPHYLSNSVTGLTLKNGATSGEALHHMIPEWESQMWPFFAASSKTNRVLVFGPLVNNLTYWGSTVESYTTNFDAYIRRAQSSNVWVLIMTPTPRDGETTNTFPAIKAGISLWVKTQQVANAWIDAGAMFPDSTDTNHFVDLTHFTNYSKIALAAAVEEKLRTEYFTCRIGTEAGLTLTNSSLWRGYIGHAPASNSVQNLNPPIFRWTYLENPSDSANNWLRTFRFQINTSTDFSSPLVNVVCSNNFYNFLAPFTNGDGSTYTSPVYWRVLYLNSNATVNVATGAVRSFTLSATATNWDRSVLADKTWITNAGVHPHMMFRDADRTNALRWCQTSVWSTSWVALSNAAFNRITNSWWGTDDATNQSDLSQYVAEVGLVWQLLTNEADRVTLSNANPGLTASIFVTNFLNRGIDRSDPEATRALYWKNLGMMYDWLYQVITAEQRSNLLYAIEVSAKHSLYKFWWYNESTADSGDRTYPGPYGMELTSASRAGGSHEQTCQMVNLATLAAAAADSAFLQEYWQYAVNYAIAQHAPYAGDGGGYNQGRNYNGKLWSHHWGTVPMEILFAQSFPEAQFHLNPFYRDLANWAMHFDLPLMSQVTDPWGDNSVGRVNAWLDWGHRDLAFFTRDGAHQQQWQKVKDAGSLSMLEPAQNLLVPFVYPPVAQTDAVTNVFVNPDEGWVIANSTVPNIYTAFTNGVGFITQARPRGSEVNHSSFSDGHVQLWAYGAMLTDGGANNYRKHPMYLNSLFVDGIGQCLPQRPMDESYARLTAWTNNSLFSYVALDLTRAFNRTNFSIGGYGLNNDFVNFYTTNRVPQVASVKRHILFPRHRYWVIYDQLVSTQASTFSMNWHVLEPTATVDTNGCSFTYTATNHYHGSNVTVHFKSIVDPTLMTLTNVAGTNISKLNPLTGEDYTASDASTNPKWNSTEWISNQTPTTNWHFMTVVYPQKWDESAPTITRIDDYTVAVTNGSEGDVISFDTNSAVATLIVDAGATNAPPAAPPETTATPVFSPASGQQFLTSLEWSLSCATQGAGIWWNSTGSPTTNSTLYSVPLTATCSTNLYAIAWSTNGYSAVASASYTKTNAPAPPASTNSSTVVIIRGNVTFR